MFDYLSKFNNLDSQIKLSVSNPNAVRIIEELESKYKVDLAVLIMKVMVKEVEIGMLPLTIFSEFKLNQEKSEKLAEDLKENIFSEVADYLGFISKPKKKKIIAKESNIKNKKIQEAPTMLEKVVEPILLDQTPEKKLLKKVDSSKSPAREEYGQRINLVVEELIKILNLKFKSNDKKDRFISLLNKYLRGIKDRFSIRQILTANLESDGFSFSDRSVDSIFLTIQNIWDKEKNKAKREIKVDSEVLNKIDRLSHGKTSSIITKEVLSTENPVYKLPAVLAKEKTSLPLTPQQRAILRGDDAIISEQIKKDELLFSEIDHPKAIREEKERFIREEGRKAELEEDKKVLEKNIEKKEDEVKKIEKEVLLAKPMSWPKPAIENKMNSLPVEESGKIKMTDIKRVRITSPVDELRYLDLINFRRLSANPNEAFNKIGQKLKVLEDIDYSKMLEGIKAWRQSPINKLYLKMFFKASEEGADIDKVIENLKNSGQDYLSRSEIEALIKFNKVLVF